MIRGFPKRGRHSAGVGPQYCGVSGRVENCQVGVFLYDKWNRNPAQPLSLIMWSKIVEDIAHRAGLPRFTTHTPRHLRLTHMARAHMDLHQIAMYAGHASLETTMLYIHLSGIELTEAVSQSMAHFEQWIAQILGEMSP